MNKLLVTDVDYFSIVKNYEDVYAKLSPYRKEKVSKRKILSDKLLTVTSSALLIRALLDVGFNEEDAIYEENSSGKPSITNVGNFNFSISHSENMAICAYGEDIIGADIEYVKYPNYNIIGRFFTEEEKEFLSTFTSNKIKEKMFFYIWTGKEAVSKAIGKGISIGFNSFSLVKDGVIANSVEVDGKILHIKYDEYKDYVICVASLNEEFEDITEVVFQK